MQILRSLKEPERDLPGDADGSDINREVSATAVLCPRHRARIC